MLVGCGVPTGWGSAVNAADVQPGETVIVSGVGGIGINAVQGARYAGAKNLIAVDPLENKREKAMELGATHAVGTIEEATELARQLTNGNGADKAIVTAGLVTERIVTGAFDAIGKGGTVVLTGLNKLTENNIQLPGRDHDAVQEDAEGHAVRRLQPDHRHPEDPRAVPERGHQARRADHEDYTLDQVNEGYDDLLNGKNVRGVMIHEH